MPDGDMSFPLTCKLLIISAYASFTTFVASYIKILKMKVMVQIRSIHLSAHDL